MYLLLFLSARASYDAKDTAEAFVLLSKRHLALRTWHATPASTEPTSGYARTRPRCLKWPLCMSFVACGTGKTCMCALRRTFIRAASAQNHPAPKWPGATPHAPGSHLQAEGRDPGIQVIHYPPPSNGVLVKPAYAGTGCYQRVSS